MRVFYRSASAIAIVFLLASSGTARDPEEALLRDVRLEVIHVPLIQVLTFISEQHDVQITIDVRTDVNEPITRDIKKITVAKSLTSILTPLGLKYRTDARAITVEPIDPKAYAARMREKRDRK